MYLSFLPLLNAVFINLFCWLYALHYIKLSQEKSSGFPQVFLISFNEQNFTMEAMKYGAYVNLLGIVLGVGADQILIKGIWEGESPIKVEDQGINSSLLKVEGEAPHIAPGDYVKVTVQVVEKRIPRSGADLDSPMVPGGEVALRLVRIEKLTIDQLISELSEISQYIYSVHFKPLGGEVKRIRKEDFSQKDREVLKNAGFDDWSWAWGDSGS